MSYFNREVHKCIYDAAMSIENEFAKTVAALFAFLNKPLRYLLYLLCCE